MKIAKVIAPAIALPFCCILGFYIFKLLAGALNIFLWA